MIFQSHELARTHSSCIDRDLAHCPAKSTIYRCFLHHSARIVAGSLFLMITGLLSVTVASAQESSVVPAGTNLRAAWDRFEHQAEHEPSFSSLKKVLRKDELLSQSSQDTNPNVRILEEIAGQYDLNQQANQFEEFKQVRTELHEFIHASRLRAWDEIQRLILHSLENPPDISRVKYDQDRVQLLNSVAKVETRLKNDVHRERWLKYLHIELLKSQAGPGEIASDAVLIDICDRLWSARAVWPDDVIITLERQVRQFAKDSRVHNQSDYLTVRTEKLKQLTSLFTSYKNEPDEEVISQIGLLAGWFTQRNDCDKLIDALNAEFLRPNIVFRLSEAALQREFNKPISLPLRLEEVFPGKGLTGEGTFKGDVRVGIANKERAAAVEVEWLGQIHPATLPGRQGAPALNFADNSIIGEKVIIIRDFDLQDLPASVQTKSTTVRESSNDSAFSRSPSESSPPQEQLTFTTAKRYIEQEFDKTWHSKIESINNGIRNSIIYPVIALFELPCLTHTSVKGEYLEFTAVEADLEHWGAETSPPMISLDASGSLQVHKSAIEHVAQSRLAGRRLSAADLMSLNAMIAGTTPNPETDDEDSDSNDTSLFLKFDASHPITIELRDNQLSVTLNLKEIQVNDSIFPEAEIGLVFQLEAIEGNVRIVRDAPPRVIVGDGGRVSGKQLVIRKTMSRKLASAIPPEIVVSTAIPANPIKGLHVSAVNAKNGWLTIEVKENLDTTQSK